MATWISLAILSLMLSHSVFGWTVGPPICSQNANTRLLRSDLNIRLDAGETVEDVFGCVVDPTNSALLNRVNCTPTEMVVTESNQNITYLLIRSTVNMDNASDVDNGCGITATTLNGKVAYRLIVAVRRRLGFINQNDANYRWYCVRDSATQLFQSTNILVDAPLLNVNLNATMPELTMQVLKPDSTSNTGYTATSTLNAGDAYALGVTVVRPLPHSDFLTPWGVYMFNTEVRSSNQNGALTLALIGSDGCVRSEQDGNNGLRFVTPFVRQASQSSQSQSVYRTGNGEAFRWPDSNEMWFYTYVEFCFGPYEEDQRCVNFCSNPGRKKRDVELERQIVFAKVTVVETEVTEKDSLVPMLIGLTVGVIVLLLIVVAIATYIFCVRSKRGRKSTRSRFSNSSSYASSMSYPEKY